MSAINDALRRASSVARTTPPPPPAEANAGTTPPPLPPMPVAVAAPPPIPEGVALPPPIDGTDPNLPPPIALASQPRRRSSVLPVFFCILVLFCVAGATGSYLYAKKHGPFLAKIGAIKLETNDSLDADDDETINPETNMSIRATATTTTAVVNSSVVDAPPTNAIAPAVGSTPVAVVPTRPTTVAPAVPVRFPPLRLQSIFYRPSNPSVMINGKTLFVADEIQGVTIAAIQPSSVTLVLSGQTNVLTLR